MCGICPAASLVPCWEGFSEFGDAVNGDAAAAGGVVPFDSAQVPFAKSDGLCCHDEVFVVSRVGAAHFGLVGVKDNPHGADFGRLVGEVEPYGDSCVWERVVVQV